MNIIKRIWVSFKLGLREALERLFPGLARRRRERAVAAAALREMVQAMTPPVEVTRPKTLGGYASAYGFPPEPPQHEPYYDSKCGCLRCSHYRDEFLRCPECLAVVGHRPGCSRLR